MSLRPRICHTCPASNRYAWFYFEIRSSLSEMPEVSTTVQNNIQIERMREQQEKNWEKTAREGSKRGESGSLTEDGKLYRCRSFNSIFTSKNHTLNFFCFIYHNLCVKRLKFWPGFELFNLENAHAKNLKNISTSNLHLFRRGKKSYDRKGELDQQSIFEATFRKILH